VSKSPLIDASFNPVLGFLSVSTVQSVFENFAGDVSIPCWVF